MGDPLRREIVVEGGHSPALPELVLSGPANLVRTPGSAMPVRPWPEVIDRIGVTLASSRDSAKRSGELAKARRLADDAYFGEFEASDMESAIRRHLGYARSGEIEQQFRQYRSAIRDVSERKRPVTDLDDLSYRLLLDLNSAARDLDTKGVTDRSRNTALEPATAASSLGTPAPAGDPKPLLRRPAGRASPHRPGGRAEWARRGASELATVYTTEFEPLERYLLGRSPQSVRPLEVQFNSLRGDLYAGLKGAELNARLDQLYDEVETLVTRLESRPAGTFGTAFFESLITIVREGVEVILVLAMLIALVAKASPPVTKTDGLTVMVTAPRRVPSARSGGASR